MSDAYIGVPFINEVSPRNPKEDFSGSDFGSVTVGSTTYSDAVELSLDVPGANTENLMVVLDNVVQEPDTAYTIHENASSQPRILNFSETPDSSAVIYVIHRGIGGYNIAPPAGSVGSTELSNDMKSYTVDEFTGDGSTTGFTLSETPFSASALLVSIDGVIQKPGASANYTVSGSTLTFTSAPAASQEIEARHLGVRGVKRRAPEWQMDSFTGDGSTTTFTLNTAGASTNNSFVYYNGVALKPTSDYTINTSTGVMTVTFAPINASEIVVRYQL